MEVDKDSFWKIVHDVAREIYGLSEEVASKRVSQLRTRVEESGGEGEDETFYHLEPFYVAGDVASRELRLNEFLDQYEAIVRRDRAPAKGLHAFSQALEVPVSAGETAPSVALIDARALSLDYATVSSSILARTTDRIRLIQFHLVALGVMLGAAATTFVGPWIVLAIPVESALLGLVAASIGADVALQRDYIRNVIEPRVRSLASEWIAPTWETFRFQALRANRPNRFSLEALVFALPAIISEIVGGVLLLVSFPTSVCRAPFELPAESSPVCQNLATLGNLLGITQLVISPWWFAVLIWLTSWALVLYYIRTLLISGERLSNAL